MGQQGDDLALGNLPFLSAELCKSFKREQVIPLGSRKPSAFLKYMKAKCTGISEKSQCGVSMIPGCYYAAERIFPPPLNGVLCSQVNSCTGFSPSTFCFLISSQPSLSCGAFSSSLLCFLHPLLSFYDHFNFSM